MRAHLLRDDGTIETTTRAEDVRAAHAAKRALWVDLEARTPETESLLVDTFALHPLTIEDVWTDSATPKLEQIGDYVYVLAHSARRGADPSECELVELDVVIGTTFVLTHDAQGSGATLAVHEELARSPRLLAKGPAWLAHAFLDRLVDGYLPLVDDLDDRVEALEGDVVAKAGTPEGREVLARIFALKRSLQSLRRASLHEREMLLRLSRGDFEAIPREALPYFRDVYDHLVRVADLAESYRDLASSALDAYLSAQSNRLNEIMKALTLISTVMLPLTFIAGVYGMNFDVMPELRWRYGYAFALAVMATMAALIVGWFRRRRWV
jgi:magnesium transporter